VIDENERPYPQPMLPGVDYQTLDDYFGTLTDLEFDTLNHCKDFLKELEVVLLKENMVQTPELIIAHLCSYLGAVTAIYGADKAQQLEPDIIKILKEHANFSFFQFAKHPVNGTTSTKEEQQSNAEKLRACSPGSIVVQTVRLGRVIMDMMDQLGTNKKMKSLGYPPQKQKEIFCPQDDFFAFIIPLINGQHLEWQETLSGKSGDYAINQLAIQIAWFIGYFSHLDEKQPGAGLYFEYGIPCVTMFREFTQKLLKTMLDKGQVLTSMQTNSYEEPEIDHETETLLREIHELSSKTHADIPPAFTQFQKETAIVQAGMEKLIVALMNEDMAVKIVFGSTFYFWFMLDAPLRVKDPTIFDDHNPMDEMVNIIELIKATANTLPEAELSPELKELNAKMQILKSQMPDPESLDEVQEDTVVEQTNKVNTAIHTAIADYLKKNYHPEIIANVLFSHWLRLSVFYGVSESDWQKMDHYLPEILAAVREYISTMEHSYD